MNYIKLSQNFFNLLNKTDLFHTCVGELQCDNFEFLSKGVTHLYFEKNYQKFTTQGTPPRRNSTRTKNLKTYTT